MLKVTLFIVGFVAATYPAIAAEPNYVGHWIDTNGNCDSFAGNGHLDTSSLDFSQRRVTDFEGYCDITRATQHNGSWELDEDCHYGEADGNSHRHSTLSVNGDKMTIAETNNGKVPIQPFVVSRCLSAGPSWQKFDSDSYVDKSTKQILAAGKVKVSVLHDYEAITSAQMWGLSEIEVAVFDCMNSKYISASDVWFEGRMAAGNVEKTFPASSKWGPIPVYYIKLFASVCAP
jgi:hypothetical protein